MTVIDPLLERLPATPAPGQGSEKDNRQARKRLLLSVAIFFSASLLGFFLSGRGFFLGFFFLTMFLKLFVCTVARGQVVEPPDVRVGAQAGEWSALQCVVPRETPTWPAVAMT
jgi:hypothetical protein